METMRELCKRLDFTYVESAPPVSESSDLFVKFPISFAKKNEIAPVGVENGVLTAITARPLNHHAVADIRGIFAMPVRLVVAESDVVTEYINRAYEAVAGSATDMLGNMEGGNLQSIANELEGATDILDTDEEAPIVRLLNSLLQQAIKEKASDIHVEVFADSLAVRMRVDGILYNVLKPPKKIHPQLVSRVKIMGGMDIAEKRLPQDGRISIKAAGREIDVRVSAIPTTFGERIVMRLLDKSRSLLVLDQLGIEPGILKSIKRVVELPSGIMLVTGPTGSGKTTTLYAALAQVDTERKNVITVEDPVEYQIRGIGQMQVNAAINLTFADGLRSILRQDPDIIMIGEIRDQETARIAVQASLTGHLVLSTLHTNDSAGALTRLVDIGIEPFLIASSLVGVLAQRLVRVLCPECKKLTEVNPAELERLGHDAERIELPPKIYKSVGCPACMNSGYKGRSGIHEYLQVTDAARTLLVKGADSKRILQQAISDGMSTLRHDGLRKVALGLTTLDEVLRVTDETSGEAV
ncbi:MAG: type II secretion system ATPase GspE [Nitrospinae bacterium]|nr:type II secretion system ATPase GspE [Nitrospinota bacterium]